MLDDCTIKKILDFYARVLVDMNQLSSLLQKLLVECLSFVFVADVKYERLLPFFLFL